MISREKVLKQAIDGCMKEMYLKAQPSIDYDELIEKIKSGEIKDSAENPVYKRHYLSHKEFSYIKDKWATAYNLRTEWTSNIELLESYLKDGGTKDKYIPSRLDKNGNYYPGYRGYEKVSPLLEQFNAVLDKDLALKCNKIVIDIINNCKNFYRGNRDYESFQYAVCLGGSPTSNKKDVINYWKNQGIDITIEDRNPLLFWEKDNYKENFEEIMKEDYGEDWEKYWWEEYGKQQKEAIENRERELEELRKQELTPHFKFNIGDCIRSKSQLTPKKIINIIQKNNNHYYICEENNQESLYLTKEIDKEYYHTKESFSNYY